MGRLTSALRGKFKEQQQEKARKKKPAQILADRFRGHHHEKKVDWKRDVPQNVPQVVKDKLDAVSIEHSSVREELHALRASRGAREVGKLTVPKHLLTGMELDARDVKPRADIPAILPAED